VWTARRRREHRDCRERHLLTLEQPAVLSAAVIVELAVTAGHRGDDRAQPRASLTCWRMTMRPWSRSEHPRSSSPDTPACSRCSRGCAILDRVGLRRPSPVTGLASDADTAWPTCGLPGGTSGDPQRKPSSPLRWGCVVDSPRFEGVSHTSPRHGMHHLEIHDLGDLVESVRFTNRRRRGRPASPWGT
jgi:hypothetical protein